MQQLAAAVRKELLARIYHLHEEWTAGMKLACKHGCSTCCTQSVTMTSLEGQGIIEYLRAQNRLPELAKILAQRKATRFTALTTNAFAESCLLGMEPAGTVHEEWDYTPCPFLAEHSCSIYPVRPFGCRAFVSTVNCAATGSAEASQLVITVNTVYTQIIEHLAQGQHWGKMLDILACYLQDGPHHNKNDAEGPLRRAKPLPGLIVCREEEKPVRAILERFMEGEVFGQPIRAILGIEAALQR